MALAGPETKVIDLRGRRVLPGLIDNHLHIIRGGLNFNMELRWDGVRRLADAMSMLKRQVAVTPPPQWVRVVGGFTEHQFAEKRLPTLEEINAVAPDTPVFLLHLYDRALLNAAALRAVGYTKDTPDPPGGEIVRDAERQPDRPAARQAQCRHPLRDARQGAEAAVRVSAQLDAPFHARAEPARRDRRHRRRRRLPELSGRLRRHRAAGRRRPAHHAPRLQPVHAEAEGREGGLPATGRRSSKYQQGDDYFRHNGAGEMLVFSAADFEDFREPRPDMPPEMEGELEAVVRILAQNRWPWRLHATYDETISRALDVFERVNQDMPLEGLHWFFDHAETISRAVDRPHRGARRRHRRAAPHGLPGRVLRRALRRRARPRPRRRSRACWRRASRSPPAPTPRASPPTTRGSRSPGWSPARPSAGCALSGAQLPRPRDGAADVDRERHLVLQRGGQEGPDRGRPARRSGRARPRLFRVRRETRSRTLTSDADRRRRQDRLRAPASSPASTTARRRRPCRTGRRCARFGGYAAWGDATAPASGCAARSCDEPAAAPAAAASMVTTTPARGRARCRSPISRASGVRSAAPAGRCDMGGRTEQPPLRPQPFRTVITSHLRIWGSRKPNPHLAIADLSPPIQSKIRGICID